MLLFLLGVTNVAWIAALTAFALLERLVGVLWTSLASGLLLIGWGAKTSGRARLNRAKSPVAETVYRAYLILCFTFCRRLLHAFESPLATRRKPARGDARGRRQALRERRRAKDVSAYAFLPKARSLPNPARYHPRRHRRSTLWPSALPRIMIMVWLFLIASIPSVLGNFLMPIMIGAKDLAFPRLNLLSWYLYLAGGLIVLTALFLGGVDTGWTFYTPYSSMFSNSWVSVALVGVFVVGFSSILTGLNFIVTVHTLRAPGLGWFKLPLFVWAHYATAIILVLATPVLAITTLLVVAERLFQIGVFDPAHGGDPLLFQHLFWFYSHPAVYIMILPAMGVVSEIIPCFARRPIFGYRFMAYAILGIASIGFLVAVFGAGCRRRRPWANAHRIDIAALYWHFVDIVWIVLHPLLYLVDRHA